MTVLERTIEAYTKDAGDDVVWSNWVYPLATLGAQSLTAAVTVALTGAALALASGAYHAVYSDYTQRLDTTAMMGYLSSVTGCLVAGWVGLALAPVAYAFYWLVETDSQIHVPAWAALALSVVAVKAQWWALVPAVLFVGAGALQLRARTDSWLHSIWHILGSAAAGTALFLS
ncbi:hypothetical protein GGP89_002427 [Salinibacter ruber]|uniref:Uncharacterized protein n=1 Tax=Salinibacter ruber TaxID=146919 RepID=A0A9X2U215_9BACT|nr:hypothetical protein [Salinibacter ruber]MCS3859035.1 hypothetical protein [Salinibacter ruber]MCS3865888.1 hypothetical protein [Salinibacter ruber]